MQHFVGKNDYVLSLYIRSVNNYIFGDGKVQFSIVEFSEGETQTTDFGFRFATAKDTQIFKDVIVTIFADPPIQVDGNLWRNV